VVVTYIQVHVFIYLLIYFNCNILFSCDNQHIFLPLRIVAVNIHQFEHIYAIVSVMVYLLSSIIIVIICSQYACNHNYELLTLMDLLNHSVAYNYSSRPRSKVGSTPDTLTTAQNATLTNRWIALSVTLFCYAQYWTYRARAHEHTLMYAALCGVSNVIVYMCHITPIIACNFPRSPVIHIV
jgi:hypothetical protein